MEIKRREDNQLRNVSSAFSAAQYVRSSCLRRSCPPLWLQGGWRLLFSQRNAAVRIIWAYETSRARHEGWTRRSSPPPRPQWACSEES